MSELGTIAGLLVPWCIGLLLLRNLWPIAGGGVRLLALRLALGFGLGAGVTSLLVFVALLGFGKLDGRVCWLELGVLAALLPGALRRARGPEACAESPLGLPRVGQALLALLLAVILVATFAAVQARSRQMPYGGWDAWAIWNVRARFLVLGGEAWRTGFCTEVGVGHPDYPLLWIGQIAQHWTWIGDPSNAAGICAGILVAALVPVALFGGVGLLRGRAVGMLAAAAWCGCHTLTLRAHEQCADIPLSLFCALALILSVLAESRPEVGRLRLLAGACLGCAAWTKNEGILFLAAFLALHGLAALWRGGLRPGVVRVSTLLAGALPFLIALVWFKLAIAPENDLVSESRGSDLWTRLSSTERWQTVARAFWDQLGWFHEPEKYGPWLSLGMLPLLVSGGLVAACFTSREERRQLRLPLVIVVAMLALYFLVYVLTPKDLAWHLESSLDRLILQLWPMAVFVLCLAFRGERSSALSS